MSHKGDGVQHMRKKSTSKTSSSDFPTYRGPSYIGLCSSSILTPFALDGSIGCASYMHLCYICNKKNGKLIKLKTMSSRANFNNSRRHTRPRIWRLSDRQSGYYTWFSSYRSKCFNRRRRKCSSSNLLGYRKREF